MKKNDMDRSKMGHRDRSAQKRRTRRAILAAAVSLIEQNETPTMRRVAEVAEVSPRTVYVYFPTREHLLTEAALKDVRGEVDRALDVADVDDVWSRLDTLVDVMLQSCIESEVQLRTLIRLTIEQRLAEAQGAPERQAPLRGERRVEWIETALAPVREQLGEARFEQLVSALALCVGIEALLVLRDIRGLEKTEMQQVSRWAAHALVRASLAEVD